MKKYRCRARKLSRVNHNNVPLVSLHWAETIKLRGLFGHFGLLSGIAFPPTFLVLEVLCNPVLCRLKLEVSQVDVQVLLYINQVNKASFFLFYYAHVLVHFSAFLVPNYKDIDW